MKKQSIRRDRAPTGRPPGRRKRPDGLPSRSRDRYPVYEAWARDACILAGRPGCLVKVIPKDSSEVLLVIVSEIGRQVERDLDKLTTERDLRDAVKSVLLDLPSKIEFPGPRPFIPGY